MSILTKDIRDEFIGGLRAKYAKALPSKSIANKDDIMFAAANLYAYGTPFVNQGKRRQSHYGTGTTDIQTIKKELNNYVAAVLGYFKKPYPKSQADFDNDHKNLCEIFLRSITKYQHTYGNAQKMTNILFKYLACFMDASIYEDWFKYCHMALDRFTYNGYRLPFYRDVVYPRIYGSSASTLTLWSCLKDVDYTTVTNDIINYVNSYPKTYNYYLDICQKKLHILSSISHLSTSHDYELTPFEAEFFLWIIAKKCKDKSVSNATIETIKSLL